MYRVSWMKPIDYELLEHMKLHDDVESGYTTTAHVLHLNVGKSKSYTGKRCRELRDRGLFESPGRAEYRLSELGRRFVDGDVDPSELDDE